MNVLLQWHHQDPVSQKEIDRNNVVYNTYQHNRNPYIDNPQWADSVWTSAVTGFKEEAKFAQAFSIYPNPSTNQFTIINYFSDKENSLLKVKDVSGKVIEEKIISSEDNKGVDCSQWQTGIYFISISNSNSVSNFKFIKQ